MRRVFQSSCLPFALLALFGLCASFDGVADAQAPIGFTVDDDGLASGGDCDGTGPVASRISDAITADMDGLPIFVCPGIYRERLDFNGKAITVRSVAGPLQTVIDGDGTGTVVIFNHGETRASTLDGFTIMNGTAGFVAPNYGRGGGIWVENASPSILNNIIRDNRACSGAGVALSFSSALVRGNRIADNVQAGCSGGTGGGGILVGGAGTALILDNEIVGNAMTSAGGGGISLFAAGSAVIERNRIAFNSVSGLSPCAEGGGLSLANEGTSTIVGNLFLQNTAGCGGGVYASLPSFSATKLVNNTFVDNAAALGAGLGITGFAGTFAVSNNIIVSSGSGDTAVHCDGLFSPLPPTFRSNDVVAPSGTRFGGICTDVTGQNGNISADPQFTRGGLDGYRLRPTSPAVDAGQLVAGVPAREIDGERRISDGDRNGLGVVDIGFDELFVDELFVDFGTPWGVWRYDDRSGYTRLHPLSPETMATGDIDNDGIDDLVLDFGPAQGVWTFTGGTTWSRLAFQAPLDPDKLAIADLDGDGAAEIVFNVVSGASQGLFTVERTGAIRQWFSYPVTDFAVVNLDGRGGDQIVANIRAGGVRVLSHGYWSQLHPFEATTFQPADLDGDGHQELVIEFPGFGLWIYDVDSGWQPLHPFGARHIAAGDTDGDGRSDLAIDFGAPYGVWQWTSGGGWQALHPLATERLRMADVDGTGRQDLLLDFGPYGLWALRNGTTWTLLHPFNPADIQRGRLR